MCVCWERERVKCVVTLFLVFRVRFVRCRSSTIPLSLSSIRLCYLFHFGWILVYLYIFVDFSSLFIRLSAAAAAAVVLLCKFATHGSSSRFSSNSSTRITIIHIMRVCYTHNCSAVFCSFAPTHNNYGHCQFYLLFEVNFCLRLFGTHKCW